MPIREKVLEELLEKIGLRHRPKVQRAIRFEEEKEFEKALAEWEEIVAEVRKEGKDLSVIQDHLKRLHRLWWQRGGPQRREPWVEAPERGEAVGGREQDKDRDGSYAGLKRALKTELQNRCIGEGLDLVSQSEENLLRIRSLLDEVIKERLKEIPDWVKRKDLMEEIMNDVLGLGVLEEYLKDPKVNEVMINGTDVFYEKDGVIHEAPRRFHHVDEVRKVIDRIVQPIGRRVDESSPLVEGRLPDGSRVNIVIPPVALDGPVITVRKFAPVGFTEEQMLRSRAYSEAMSAFFRLAVRHRQNVIIAGRASSGKTTLLNILAGHIPKGERIITIEDMAELRLSHPHVVRMEARPANLQGKGEITIRTLFRNALRMRPDRIIVGECRGAETLDMLQAMNTGHDGSISTAHANSPRDLFARLEAMVQMSDIPMSDRTVRKQVASGVDIVVYCVRFTEGQRKVVGVCEVVQGEGPEEEIQIREIFEFRRGGGDGQERVSGEFVSTGYVPTFVLEDPELNQDPGVMDLFRDEAAGRGARQSA